MLDRKYTDFMDEISSDELYEGLLAYGFFAEKLPPVFSSVPFFNYCKTIAAPFEAGWNEYITFRVMRNNSIPRIMGIPNPFKYQRACSEIRDDWDKIRAHFHAQTDGQSYRVSRIHIRKEYNKKRIFDMNYKNWRVDGNPESDLLIHDKGTSRFLVEADVSTCFPSIYTHSIPWALVGKEKAKQTVRDNTWYNRIDQACSDMRNGETHGLLTYVSDDDRYSLRDSHDATVIRYIETLREQCNDPKDIFLVSTDKILRFWDINRNSISYPIVIYPSQLFLILLKTCGRSQDDYDCFVSFINIRSKSKQISPEKAHIILSGISSITEDIQAQEHLVSAVFDDEFQNIIKHSTSDEDLYRKIQSKSQNYLNNRLKKSQRKVSQLEKSLKKKDGVVAQLQSDLTKKDESLSVKIEENERTATELEQTKDNIASFAEKKTRMLLAWKCTIFPIVLLILTIVFALFVFLQFAFSSKEWNCVVPFIQWVKSTPFGQAVGDALYAIDLAIAAALGFALKKWMTNPFNSLYREKKKEELIQHYLEKNKLE